MGRKTNSVSLRLNKTNKHYNNCWYSDILYADNFSNTLKLGNYISQTLKTVDMPCPQTSIIGAYKKASFLVCYLDPKKRVRLLEKSGVRSNTPFLSLNKKIKQDPKLLNPVVAQKTCLEGSFAGPSLAKGMAVDTSFCISPSSAQITRDIKIKAKDSQQMINEKKAEQKHTASVQALRLGLNTKDNKVVPSKGLVDPEKGLITCSGLTLPSCATWPVGLPLAQRAGEARGKSEASPLGKGQPEGARGKGQKISGQSSFERTRHFVNQSNGMVGGFQTLETHKFKPCGHDGSNYTEQEFRRYFFYRGPLGLEMSLQLLDLQLTDMPFQGLPLLGSLGTPFAEPSKKGRALSGLGQEGANTPPSVANNASKIQGVRSSQNHVMLASNTFPPFLKKTSLGQQNYPTCSKTTTLQTIQDAQTSLGQQGYQNNSLFSIGPGIFPDVLEIFPQRFSRFKYFFEEFFSGIGNHGPFHARNVFNACPSPERAAPMLTTLAQQEGHLLRERSKRSKAKGVPQINKQSSSIVFKQTSNALGRAVRQQKTIKRVVTEKISLVCAFYKNMFIYGGKGCNTSYVFGPRLCTFSNRLIYNNYCRNRYYKTALVYKKPVYVLKTSQSGSLNSLYGFYDNFSRFWENLVFLSFYKSTNETCCALFLADTVAYLLERKVLFRSVKRQLLILLNNSKKSVAVSKNLLSKLFTINKRKTVTGIRISCSGRVGGRSKKAQRSRKDTFMWGETGLHVFSSKLDFAKTHAETPFGTVGVQVWVCTK